MSAVAVAWTGAAFALGVLIVSYWQLRQIQNAVSRNNLLTAQIGQHHASMVKICEDVTAAIGGQVAAIGQHYEAMKQFNASLGERTPAGQFKDLNNQIQCKIRALHPRTEIHSPEEPQPC